MRAQDGLGQLFEDLEQQANGLHLAERDAEVEDRSRAEYAGVTFAARLHASVGATLRLAVDGVGALVGTVVRVGDGWFLVEAAPSRQEWVVSLRAVTRAGGLSGRAVNEVARPVSARLSLRSALRGLADARTSVVVHTRGGAQVRGRLGRVGADFVELVPPSDAHDRVGTPGPPDVLPFSGLAAIRCG
ncbi:MAG TPA: hypothetical protein VFG63_15325 [Nocardioidaceae bacterium]|nr:hypothetical protein [Nocardioidaceae bacterium]